MPRKKQGLRSYHHKSRNGCMQCKRRRVKCGMQQPACANCSRRNEICEYPPPVDDGSTTPPPSERSSEINSWAVGPQLEYHDTVSSSAGLATHASPPFLPDFQSNPTDSDAPYCPRTRKLLDGLLGAGSWFSAPETVLWTDSIAKAAPKYPYLQHCVQAIAHMKHHNLSGLRWPSTSAYQHHLLASRIFRETTHYVDGDNWMAVLAFAIIMLIFQFGSQINCDEEHFNIIETLQALRNTLQIEEAAREYFHRTEFWKLIQARTSVPILPDLKMRSAMHSLSFAVLNVFQEINSCNDGTGPGRINRQAFMELEKWAVECQGRPIRWDQYQEWPRRVFPEFLDLVAGGDDTALLILIHWTAIMSRSSKPFVKAWAVRAGLSTVNRLKGNWHEQLAWPLEVFIEPMASENAPRQLETVPLFLQLPSYTGPDQTPVSDPQRFGDPHGFPMIPDDVAGMPMYPCSSSM
ncbi:hypothetical protein DPSP01_007692 [Paraphaeosphaeria sporulosa]|uniref:Zn(2)-C6 fungal-type domain-containing protein n=1 Tax=Paraphaeosphaeria sporulosa TaxID=1460663 RepID=A0A177CDH4_9PLEO|nr:uncharacterized protein CC84DRAFT_804224 [Paraphaeosphaeria sporulosa]OAG04818.1 hypothetical protein CC84DRAFT_804224 [Paraphaeosphaeria sporulosa]